MEKTTVFPAYDSVFNGDETILMNDLISDGTHSLFQTSIGFTLAAISITGIGTNIINLVTFVKMGFKDTINISLATLAATDLGSLISLLWNVFYYIPPFNEMLSVTLDVTEVDFITSGLSKTYLTNVAGYITSIVAVERCLCVLMPLKVKVIFTRDRLVRVLFVIFILVFSPFMPLCFTTRLGWVFKPDRNRTIISLIRNRDLIHIDGICFVIIVCQYVSCYVVVFVSTVIIVWKLASQSAWRAAKTTDNAQQAPGCTVGSPTEDGSGTEKKAAAMSGRDRRATKTVTFIAAMYIVCTFPSVVTHLAMAFVPDFNKGMRYNKTYDIIWSIVFLGDGISSSANILVYLKTSVKFRETFMGLFRSKIRM